MQILWKIKEGFVKDIIEHFPDPKPAYNTVSTIIRILVKKGFANHKAYGKSHQYFPVISKVEYTKKYLSSFMENYFGNSFKSMVHFMSENKDLSVSEVDDVMKMLEQIKKQKEESEG